MSSVAIRTGSWITVVALAVLTGCATSPRPESGPVEGHVVQYEVFGMDCPGCHGGLEKLALDIDGVLAARASWEQKSLTLTIAEGAEVSDEAIRSAVERANFTAGERSK